jgi:hypothetical protein
MINGSHGISYVSSGTGLPPNGRANGPPRHVSIDSSSKQPANYPYITTDGHIYKIILGKNSRTVSTKWEPQDTESRCAAGIMEYLENGKLAKFISSIGKDMMMSRVLSGEMDGGYEKI